MVTLHVLLSTRSKKGSQSTYIGKIYRYYRACQAWPSNECKTIRSQWLLSSRRLLFFMFESISKTTCEIEISNGSIRTSGRWLHDKDLQRLGCGSVTGSRVQNGWCMTQISCSERGIYVTMKYQSRRKTFYEKLKLLVGQKASYVRTLVTG